MNVGQGFGLDAFPTPIALAVAIFDDRVSAALSPCLDQGWLEVFIHSLCGSAIPVASHLVPLNDLVLGHGGADGHRGHAKEAVARFQEQDEGEEGVKTWEDLHYKCMEVSVKIWPAKEKGITPEKRKHQTRKRIWQRNR